MAKYPAIATFPNELIDRIFANLEDAEDHLDIPNRDLLNLCKAHRSFKLSAQRLIFRRPRLTAQHVADSTGAAALFVEAIVANPELTKYVQGLQLNCSLDSYTPWGKLVLDQDYVSSILAKLTNIEHVFINLMKQHTVDVQQIAVIRNIANMVRNLRAKSLVIIGTLYQVSIINEILRIDVPISIIVTPDSRGGEYNPDLQAPLNWTSHMDLSNVHCIVFEEGTRNLIDTTLSEIAEAPRLKSFHITLRRQSVEEVVAAFEPLKATIQELVLRPYMDCEFHRDLWKPANFSTFSQLTRLSVPSSAWWPGELCDDIHVGPGLAWEHENRNGIMSTLPPNISMLEITFKYPNGVFVRESSRMKHFNDMPEETQTEGCRWMLGFLQSGLKIVSLVEVFHDHSRIRQRFAGEEDLAVTVVTYVPPRAVREAFVDSEVKLYIQVLQFSMEITI